MKLTTNSVIKNRLVQYKGGGYDGCHWEWNAFLFDADGKFHNIATSGRNGVKDLSEAIETLNNDSPYIYKLNDSGIKEFVTECNEAFVKYISKAVNQAYGSDIIMIECQSCGDMTDPDYMFSTGYHGNGGIGIVETDFVCGDCYCSNSCGHCGEYIGPDYDPVDGWACVETTVENLEGDSTKEAIELAFKSVDECFGPFCQHCADDLTKDKLKA